MDRRIHIMGIVNLTGDSFFAGSRTASGDVAAVAQQMWADGATVVDLGACSTRPGAVLPSLEEEWARLKPALKALSHCGKPLSIDTFRAEIVRRAHEIIGSFLVNDISAGQMDPEMLSTVGRLGLSYVAMHMRGTPKTMQQQTEYGNLMADILSYFQDFSRRAEDAGIREWILDPGFGFAKTVEQNYELLRRLPELACIGRPILAGVSRKSMIYKPLGITPEEALPATQAVQLAALERGATWLRVHDVAQAVQTARIYQML